MELVQRAVFLELGDGSIDFLLQFLIVLVEAEGKVLDFGIRNIDDAECALAIGSYEVIGSRFIQDACISAAGLEFHVFMPFSAA